MTVLQIPLADQPQQTLSVVYGSDTYKLNIRYVSDGHMFVDIYYNGSLIRAGRRALNNEFLIASYDQVPGNVDFYFVDSTGADAPPTYPGLNSRWFLVQVTA